ncbi:MAG: FAD-dependent oxidoreductase [Bacilli bacterium]|nr:FAD-dependent oxidoreductase [Bacilli bacterium]
MYDVIVIGMGPAGMNAALYAKRSGLNVLLLESVVPGGQVANTNLVENYLGFESISGPDLAVKMFEHIIKAGIEYKIESVRNIKILKNSKNVITSSSSYKTKAIIICTGRQRREFGFPNEKELVGKGLSYCAVCDAPLFKNKDVVVIGAGNSAFEEGIFLANTSKSVTLINRSEAPRADAHLQDKASKISNFKVLNNTVAKEIKTNEEGYIESVLLDNGKSLKCEGVFVYIGFAANFGYLEKFGILDKNGFIKVDKSMRTSEPLIYAAGDIIKKDLYQITTACAEGAIAAISAKKDLTK